MKKRAKKLQLSRETLRRLDSKELRGVAGGNISDESQDTDCILNKDPIVTWQVTYCNGHHYFPC